MYSKIKYILAGTLILLGLFLCALFIYIKSDWTKNIDADFNTYKPYVLNTEIDFSGKGKSSKYINIKDGWGGQQPGWRITIGKESTMNLYVKDGKNTEIILNITGWGVYDREKDTYQTITVFANDQNIGELKVSGDSTYTMIIPSTVMVDDKLSLRFVTGKPRRIENTERFTGMAITKMTLKKQSDTKKKLAKWLKTKLNNM